MVGAREVLMGVALGTGVLAILLVAVEVPPFFDNCHAWGVEEGSKARVPAACTAWSGSSETQVEAGLRLAIVFTLIAAPSLCGFLGGMRRETAPIAVAAVGYGAVTLLGFGLGALVLMPFGLLSTVVALVAWWRLRRQEILEAPV